MGCRLCNKLVPMHTFIFPRVTCDDCNHEFTAKTVFAHHMGLRNSDERGWYHVFAVSSNLRCSNCNSPINYVVRDCGDEDKFDAEVSEYVEVDRGR